MTWSKSGKIKLFINGILQTTWIRSKHLNFISPSNSAKIILGKNYEEADVSSSSFQIKYYSVRLHDKALKKQKIKHFYQNSNKNHNISGLFDNPKKFLEFLCLERKIESKSDTNRVFVKF